MRIARNIIVLSATALLITACASQPTPMALNPPGFWSGLIHGLIAPFAFVASLFSDVRIYAYPNSGVWYDFGFMLGIGALFGGGGSSI